MEIKREEKRELFLSTKDYIGYVVWLDCQFDYVRWQVRKKDNHLPIYYGVEASWSTAERIMKEHIIECQAKCVLVSNAHDRCTASQRR